MTPTIQPYEFLVRFDSAGALAGMHYQTRAIYRDDDGTIITERIGDPQPVEAGSDVLTAVLGDLNTAALAQVQNLTAQLATAKADAQTAATTAASGLALVQQTLQGVQADSVKRSEDDQATIAGLQAQIATLTAQAQAAQNMAAFAEAVPAEMQPQFAATYAIVRILVQAGQLAMARHVIEQTPVPDELAAAKAKLLAALTPAA